MNSRSINSNVVALLILLLVACNKKASSETESKRVVFDQGNLKVITTSINLKLKTMSVLYGNNKVYEAALKGNGEHVEGEKYTFLTWSYIENPKWFGSNISKNLLSVESIKITKENEGEGLYHEYNVEQGHPLPVNGVQLNTRDRIAYLFEYRPSILP